VAFLTLPFEAQPVLLPGLAGALGGKVVVSTAVPVRFDPDLGPVAVGIDAGSAAQEAAALLPTSRVVAAMHTVSSAHLGRLEHDLDEDVVMVGDDADAKAAVAGIVGMLPGVRVVDGGRLANARLAEQLAVLLLNINRLARRTVGIRFTNLPGDAAPPPKA
jgi:NADPH-dependent F420 reductase